jgi:hypothetical protein
LALRVELARPNRNGKRAASRAVSKTKPDESLAEKPSRRFEAQTARALCATPDPSTAAELLGPTVVRGYRTIVGAHTGEGKTTLQLAIVAAIVEKLELLEWRGAGGRALVLDLEQGLRSVKRRLREAGLADCDQVDYVRVPDGLALDQSSADFEAVEALLKAGRYDVVAVDPWYKAHAGDSNAEREAVDLMKVLDAWRDRYAFALVMATHCRKPQPGVKFSIHDLFGSSAIVRGAEVVLGLQRVRDGYSRLHWLKDRDGDLPIGESWGLLFDREHGFRRDPEDGARTPTTADQVRDLLEQTPWMTKEQLVAATGKKPRTVEAALREIDALSERRGSGTGHGPNLYALPDAADSQSPRTQLAVLEEA